MSLHSSFKIELKRFIIFTVITILMVVAQFWLWGFVTASANKLQEKRTQEDQLRNLQERILEVESTFENQQALLDQLEVIFPNRDSTTQAVERLETLSEKENIALEIKSITETEKDELVELRVSVVATAPATALLKYIDSIEHLSELTKIEKWAMDVVTTNDNTVEAQVGALPNYTLTMQVVFYMQANNNGQ